LGIRDTVNTLFALKDEPAPLQFKSEELLNIFTVKLVAPVDIFLNGVLENVVIFDRVVASTLELKLLPYRVRISAIINATRS
jgi:hypothetical protein